MTLACVVTDSPFQRSMDSVGGPDAKKARWSPTSFGSNGLNGLSASSARDAFANYGYGPQASISQGSYTSSSPSNGFSGSPLYATPSLSINTASATNGIPSQMSPNTAGPFTPQTQQTPASANGNASYAGFGGYNMLAMSMPGMGVLNGFPYNNQMGSFSQVSESFIVSRVVPDCRRSSRNNACLRSPSHHPRRHPIRQRLFRPL